MLRVLYLLAIYIFIFCPVASAQELPTINIMAPSSLTELVSELSRRYSSRSDVSVIASFGTSATHMAAINDGSPADVVITYDPQMVTDSKNQGLMDVNSLSDIFSDSLVVISPKDRSSLKAIADDEQKTANSYTGTEIPVMLGDSKDDTIGDVLRFVSMAHRRNLIKTYASVRSLLLHRPVVIGNPDSTRIGAISMKLVKSLLLPQLVGGGVYYTTNAREIVLEAIKRNAVAIALKSDASAIIGDNKKFQIDDVDPKLYSQITFRAFVVASKDMERPRGFLAFMQSPIAAEIIKKHGFAVIPPR